MTHNEELKERAGKVLLGNYKQAPYAIVRGEGCELFDADGKRFLDMFGGIATVSLGHNHPKVVAALEKQAHLLWHISNGYYIEPQIELAERLTRASGLQRAFFCNSGAEANEAALKLARRYFHEVEAAGPLRDHPLREQLPRPHARDHGCDRPNQVPEGLRAAAAGLLARAVRRPGGRGEGDRTRDRRDPGRADPGRGRREGPAEGLPRRRCASSATSTGCCSCSTRSRPAWAAPARWFGFQHEDVTPRRDDPRQGHRQRHPASAPCSAADEAAKALTPGAHGSTFGGNPLATAVGVAVFDTMEQDKLVERCAELGPKLQTMLRKHLEPLGDVVKEVRGMGLLIGVELGIESAGVVSRAREQGVLFNAGAEKVVRIAPAFTVTEAQLEQACRVLTAAIAEEQKAKKAS